MASKGYHTEASGVALDTVNAHKDVKGYTLFASCFCPFVQRVWVALEYLQIPYQYYEVDPYAKPKDLLDVSPKGLVPALKIHAYAPPRALNESTVILEYLQDLSLVDSDRSLLPPSDQPYARALVRLQCDHISRNIVPAFYRFLQAQTPDAQTNAGKAYYTSLEQLFAHFARAESENELGALGLWREDGRLNMTDVMFGPWLLRSTNTLKHYRGFELPKDEKTKAYVKRLLGHEAFKATCSDLSLYIDSYERYAFNRPGTSQVADAINRGESLP